MVELELLDICCARPRSAEALALRDRHRPPTGCAVLLQAGGGAGPAAAPARRALSRWAALGAALPGVPGLAAMIRHHDVLYRDLADPVAFLRGETETELAGFWPYVFGAAAARSTRTRRATYSELMADSQALVAEETLRAVSI